MINIGTVIAYRGAPGNLHYAAAKASLIGFTRVLARELAAARHHRQHDRPEHGRDGDGGDATTRASPTRSSPTRPSARYQQPEDLVGLLCFLASPASALHDRPDDPGRRRTRVPVNGERSTPCHSPMRPSRVGIDTGGTFTDLVAVDDEGGSGSWRRCLRTRTILSARSRRARRGRGSTRLRSSRRRRDDDRYQRRPHAARRAGLLPDDGGLRGHPLHPADQPQVPLRLPLAQARRRSCAGATASASCERLDEEGHVLTPFDLDALGRRSRPVSTAIRSGRRLPALLVPQPGARARACARRSPRASPTCPVSLSHEVAPIWREYERGTTVIVDAYHEAAVRRLRRRASRRRSREPASPRRGRC